MTTEKGNREISCCRCYPTFANVAPGLDNSLQIREMLRILAASASGELYKMGPTLATTLNVFVLPPNLSSL